MTNDFTNGDSRIEQGAILNFPTAGITPNQFVSDSLGDIATNIPSWKPTFFDEGPIGNPPVPDLPDTTNIPSWKPTFFDEGPIGNPRAPDVSESPLISIPITPSISNTPISTPVLNTISPPQRTTFPDDEGPFGHPLIPDLPLNYTPVTAPSVISNPVPGVVSNPMFSSITNPTSPVRPLPVDNNNLASLFNLYQSLVSSQPKIATSSGSQSPGVLVLPASQTSQSAPIIQSSSGLLIALAVMGIVITVAVHFYEKRKHG